MTLNDYYESLPEVSAPKADFLRELVTTCGVELVTARLWVKGKTTPSNPEHRRIIASAVGRPEEELFPKLRKKEE